jgi:hypothetical protein
MGRQVKNYSTIDDLIKRWGYSQNDVEYLLETRQLDAEYYQYPGISVILDPLAEAKVRRLVVHPFPYGKFPLGEVRIMDEEVERFEQEREIAKDIGTETRVEIEKLRSTENQETEEQKVKEYIDKCLADRIPKERIAVELKNKYKLSYLEIARSLNLNEGLNLQQHDALKERGYRIYKKGLEIIAEEKKVKKATKG